MNEGGETVYYDPQDHVLTKSDAISYLDFFINQRKNQARMEKAIYKWEDDKEFVREYRKSAYNSMG